MDCWFVANVSLVLMLLKIINEKTAPLITKIDNLEKENRKLKHEVDALEQYGRCSLIRISGIPEPTEEGDSTEKVRKIISDIDLSYEITNIIRSHRVGNVSNFLNVLIRDSELLWDRKISDIEVHFWIILAHINFVFFRTFWLRWGWIAGSLQTCLWC
jgi:hypothetical protein